MFEVLIIAGVLLRLLYRAEKHEGRREKRTSVQKTPKKPR